MPRVYNKYHGDAPADAVYVGRPSKWGNPYQLHNPKDRLTVLEQYKRWIYDPANGTLFMQARQELKGKDLVCWCYPKPCHADILLEIANGE